MPPSNPSLDELYNQIADLKTRVYTLEAKCTQLHGLFSELEMEIAEMKLTAEDI